jgi:hypothetical protein
MLKECKSCKEVIHNRAWVDGKCHNLQRRKYCLKCSPLGSYKGKTIEASQWNGLCISCGKSRADRKGKKRTCYVCIQKKREAFAREKIYKIVGTSCWKCGYDKGVAGTKVLDFHHVNPKEKLFSCHIRHITNLSWKRVFAEIRKCCLLCCRCHREFEVGFINNEEICKIYQEQWKKIDLTGSS